MTHQEFENLKVEDVVIITQHGKNRGKKGIVKEIRRESIRGGTAYLEPLDCEFEFSDPRVSRKLHAKNGFYGWNHESINYPTKELEFGSIIRLSHRDDGCGLVAKTFSKEITVTFKIPLTEKQPDFWDELIALVNKHFKK